MPESPACPSSASVATPVFVVGCDRSGTTLLTALIESRLGLAAPLETHFIPYFARTLFLWGDLGRRRNRERLLTAIGHFLEILLVSSTPQLDPEEARSGTLLAVLPQAEAMLDACDDFGGMIRQFFAQYALLHRKSGWVDNSSFYEPISLEVWQRHLPELQVIHIVRDGRDVALSWLRSWWGPATLGEAMRLWSRHVLDKREWGAAHPDSYLEVCYESLLGDPEGELERIAAFLGRRIEGAPTDLTASTTARILSTGGTHDLLRGPIVATNRDKWRAIMSTEEQAYCEFIASATLESSGYPILHAPISWFDRFTFGARLLVALPKRYLSLVYYAKKIKWLVPVVLFLAGPFGGRITAMIRARAIKKMEKKM
ncbi:MAG: sulfotransferase [Magnetococcales bacterium]|nr:sulfotransferase [Magnetococcales bacterium]